MKQGLGEIAGPFFLAECGNSVENGAIARALPSNGPEAVSQEYALANSQIARIVQLCDFLEHPGLGDAIRRNVPTNVPQTPGALGFDSELWIGLGMVGLWAAIDAFADRSIQTRTYCSHCKSRCVLQAFADLGVVVPRASVAALGELEDVRHLFAHNFSGMADAAYFRRRRHALDPSYSTLSCGAVFDGTSVKLQPLHLRHYAQHARDALGKSLEP
jgi:hypothetical protein